MSLKDVVGEVAGVTPADPEAARGAMLKKLWVARQADDENRHELPVARWITRDEAGRVAFAPTRPDGQQLVIGGQSVTFWQSDEFPAVLDAFEAAIKAGELDPQLIGTTPAGHSLPLNRIAPRSSS